MKKSKFLILALFVSLMLILSACVPGPRVTGSPGITLSEERVFVSYGPFVYGLDPETGNQNWTFPEESSNQIVFYAPPLITDDALYVGDLDNNFYKVNIESEDAAWTFTGASGYFIGKAAESEGVVYAPCNDGSLYALDENDGNLLWSFKTGHYIWTQPQVSADAVFIGSMDHSVYAISKDGEELWSFDMGGAVTGAPILSPDASVLFAGSFADKMVALDASSGNMLWTFDTQDSVWGNVILVEGLLYFSDSAGNLYALNAGDGSPEWQTETAGKIVGGLSALPDGFALATENGVVRAFNFDGSPKWEATLDGEIFQAPAVNQNFLVAGIVNGENLVYGFNLTGVQLWSTTPEN